MLARTRFLGVFKTRSRRRTVTSPLAATRIGGPRRYLAPRRWKSSGLSVVGSRGHFQRSARLSSVPPAAATEGNPGRSRGHTGSYRNDREPDAGLVPSRHTVGGMSLPAKRARRTVVHTSATIGAVAVIAAVFGVVAWVANLIVVGVIAIVATVVGAYVLSRP
jgi:hypothetical protein